MFNYNDLDPDFAEPLQQLDQACIRAGLTFKPFCYVRTPQEQAKLWRQSRTKHEIERQIQFLRQLKCDFLADCIEKAGPQHGRWATNAFPGMSWHQWGLAADYVLLDESGRADWKNDNAYAIRAQLAREYNLKSLYPKDGVHVQKWHNKINSLYSMQDVNDIMKENFGG